MYFDKGYMFSCFSLPVFITNLIVVLIIILFGVHNCELTSLPSMTHKKGT